MGEQLHILYTCQALHFHRHLTFSMKCVKKDAGANKLNQTSVHGLVPHYQLGIVLFRRNPGIGHHTVNPKEIP